MTNDQRPTADDHTPGEPMRYHDELNRVGGILFYTAVAIIAAAFLIDYLRH
jgi:hypothetical protein